MGLIGQVKLELKKVHDTVVLGVEGYKGKKMIGSWAVSILSFFAYATSASLFALFLPDYFKLWTEFCSPLLNPIQTHIAGVENILAQLHVLGVEARIPVVGHILSVSFLWSVLTVVFSPFYFDELKENVKSADEFSLGTASIIMEYLYAILMLGCLWLFFFSGLTVKKKFFIDTSDIPLLIVCCTSVTLASLVVLQLVRPSIKIALKLKSSTSSIGE